MARESAELRVEIPRDELGVLDGYCNGHGMDRTQVLRQIIADWSRRQLHAATVICRTARINPLAADSDRQAGGGRGE